MALLSLPFYQVDVFTSQAYNGNPVAVVVALDPNVQLEDEQMAKFANWTNLSETTFLLPPSDASKADYKLRIFTTLGELPFAGHPTIGSCKAFLATGAKPRVAGRMTQECGIGLVSLQLDADGTISFEAPDLLKTGKVDDESVGAACKAMQISPDCVLRAEWIVNGPEWCALQLRDARAVLDEVNVKSADTGTELAWGVWGLYGKGEGPDGAKVEVRTFFKQQGEDSVTGSFAAGLAVWQRGLASESKSLADHQYTISQGTKLGRQGRIQIKHQADSTWVGGQATLCIVGNVTF